MRHLATTLALILVATACSGTTRPDDLEPLVVYSGRSEDLVGPLFDRFSDDTGIPLEVRYAGSTDLASTLALEGDLSPADVFLSQDPASIGSVADRLRPLPTATLGRVPARFSDEGGRWVGLSGRARTVIYDSTTVEPDDLPDSVFDLIDERWRGDIGVAPTNGSFLAFVAAMVLIEGEEVTLQWLNDLAALDPVDFPSNAPMVAAAHAGEISVGLVNHYYVYRLEAEQGSVSAANHFLRAGDAGSLVMPSAIGILATSTHDGAERLVEFLLSDTAQAHFASETFEYPLVPTVAANPGLPPIDSLRPPDIDLSDLAGTLERAADLVAESGLS